MKLLLIYLISISIFKLSSNISVEWNSRLLKTAGVCRQKKFRGQHIAAIELSVKVCDTAGFDILYLSSVSFH